MIFSIVMLSVFSFTSAKDVTCEAFLKLGIIEDYPPEKACNMSGTTGIYTKNTELKGTADSEMRIINFYDNVKILYLPIGVVEIYPELAFYSAGLCSIKEISRDNFIGLSKLRALFLQKNSIQKIASDTFVDLISLEGIELGKIFFEGEFYEL